jgi:hypothetical protein
MKCHDLRVNVPTVEKSIIQTARATSLSVIAGVTVHYAELICNVTRLI